MELGQVVIHVQLARLILVNLEVRIILIKLLSLDELTLYS